MAVLHARRTLYYSATALILFGLGLTSLALAEPGNDNRAPDLSDYPRLQASAGNKVAFAT